MFASFQYPNSLHLLIHFETLGVLMLWHRANPRPMMSAKENESPAKKGEDSKEHPRIFVTECLVVETENSSRTWSIVLRFLWFSYMLLSAILAKYLIKLTSPNIFLPGAIIVVVQSTSLYIIVIFKGQFDLHHRWKIYFWDFNIIIDEYQNHHQFKLET